MADRDLLNAFEDCVERLAAGQSMDECLRSYPQFATVLRPMLEAGSLVRRIGFSSSEVSQARDRVRFRVAQRVRTRPRPQPVLRIMPLVASLIVICFFLAGAMTMLAENSVPGDTFYAFKLLTENVRLGLVNDSDSLEQQFRQRRIDEIGQLLVLNRAADVSFQGELQVINGTEWLIAGLRVEVRAGTSGAESVQVGDLIEVNGSTTQQGTLVARIILPIRRSETIPTIVPTVVPTVPPTTSPTLTATLTLTPTATIATATPAPTITNSPTTIPIATTCVASQPQGWVTYSVQAGDNLSALGARTGITLEELMRVNCLTNQRLIVTGQQLFLPTVRASTMTQAAPEVRPTSSEDRDEEDNSGRGENSGPSGGDDEREDEDNSGSDDDGDD
jgi:LysM repeat protein